ncbi:MAG: oligosaccharide flippase family protein [Chloroflexi bacterium]|nr:oligosaccharide flippase family protein [Chloroflexota bacterium]
MTDSVGVSRELKLEPKPVIGNAARGSTALVLAAFAGSILEYAFYILMGWLLSPAEYGIFGVSVSLMLVLSYVVTSGLPPSVGKFLSEQGAKQGAKIFKTALVANLLIGIAAGAIFYSLVRMGVLFTEASYHGIAVVLALIVVATSVATIFRFALQGAFRFSKLGIVGVLRSLAILAAGVVFIRLGLDALGAVTSFLVGELVFLVIALIFLIDLRLWHEKGWAGPAIFAFAGGMFVGNLSLTLMMNADSLGLKLFLPPGNADELIGYYRSSVTLARVPVIIALAVMQATFPFISRNAGRIRIVNTYVSKLVKYSCLFLLPFCLALIIIPRSVLLIFFPDTYLAGANSLAILGAGAFFLSLTIVMMQSFQALGRPKLPAIVLPLAALLQFGLLFLLVPRLGIEGAALATAIPYLVGLIVILGLYIYQHHLQFRLANLRLIMPLAIFGLFIYVFPHGSRILTLTALALGGLVYLVSILLFKLVSEDDLDIFVSAVPENKNSAGLTRRVRMAIVRISNLGKSPF